MYEAQKKKMQGLCDEHDLVYRFEKDRYPIIFTIKPVQGMDAQISMLENVEEVGYRSPDASMSWIFEDGGLDTKVTGGTFTISKTLRTKIESILVKMITYWQQYFFRDVLEKNALRSGLMPVIDEDEAGDTVEDIAEKSGFSATTVRRRVKLLELDKDKFKKSEERGVSLFEYMELDKLKSPERKNEMLDFIGTDNFKYKLKQAIDAEAADERRASWVERLSSFATQVTDRTGYKFARSFYVNSEVNVERPEDADTVEYFFIVETYYITLMTKDAPTTLTPEEDAKKREEQLNQERKNAAEKALSEATARAYELRADFVATVSAAAIKKRLVDIVALWAYAEYWDDTSWLTEEEIAQATGAETLAEDDEDGEDDAAFTLQAVTDAIGKTPEKALLRMIYARLGDGKSEGYFRSYWNSYTMKHEENEKLDRIYALLVKLGYEMSDDEKALQDGTHELFGEATGE